MRDWIFSTWGAPPATVTSARKDVRTGRTPRFHPVRKPMTQNRSKQHHDPPRDLLQSGTIAGAGTEASLSVERKDRGFGADTNCASPNLWFHRYLDGSIEQIGETYGLYTSELERNTFKSPLSILVEQPWMSELWDHYPSNVCQYLVELGDKSTRLNPAAAHSLERSKK